MSLCSGHWKTFELSRPPTSQLQLEVVEEKKFIFVNLKRGEAWRDRSSLILSSYSRDLFVVSRDTGVRLSRIDTRAKL